MIFYTQKFSFAFRLPSSVTTGSNNLNPIGNNDSDLLKLTHAEEVILRVENGEIDIFIDSEKTTFHLGKKKIELKEGMKLLSRNKIKIQLEGKGKQQKLRKYIRDQIIEQTSYLYGILQSPGYAEALEVSKGAAGVLGENHVVGGIKIKSIKKNKITINYKYYFTKVFQRIFSEHLLKGEEFKKR